MLNFLIYVPDQGPTKYEFYMTHMHQRIKSLLAFAPKIGLPIFTQAQILATNFANLTKLANFRQLLELPTACQNVLANYGLQTKHALNTGIQVYNCNKCGLTGSP